MDGSRIENHFNTKQQVAAERTDVIQQVETLIPEINAEVEEWIRNGSGWIIDRVEFLDVGTAKYTPFKGSCYMPLPKKLAGKKAVVNVQNRDEKCFMWSILASKHPGNHNPQRVSIYKHYENELQFTDISFPVAIEQIPIFEDLNRLSINVYGYENDKLYPMHLTSNRQSENIIHLLFLDDDDGKQHYCWIKSLNRLLTFGNFWYEGEGSPLNELHR
jgi:hypothetical protein